MNNFFSMNRTIKILRKDILSEYKNLIIWIGASVGVMIVLSALNILFQKLQGYSYNISSGFHTTVFILFLFPGGFLLTSSMFKDLHDKSKNIYWLMIPGSTFEKMLSRLLISSIFYALLILLIYPLFASLSELFNMVIFGMRHDFFNPFQVNIIKLFPYYLVFQSIFFSGAVLFRKHPFAKTLLSLTLLQIALSILFVTVMRIFFSNYFNSIQDIKLNDFSPEYMTGVVNTVFVVGKILFWSILAPFFYFFSYLKLSGKEVRDGF